jgi:hypothetical protein
MSSPGPYHGGNSRFPPWAPLPNDLLAPLLPLQAAPAMSVAAAAKTTSVRTPE